MAKRRKVGNLLALKVTAATEGDRGQVGAMAEEVREVTGSTVEIVYVDQGYTGENTAQAAKEDGIWLEVVQCWSAPVADA